MALASDGFIQQSVTYPYRAADIQQGASLPYVNTYHPASADVNITDIDPTLEAGIYNGALALNLDHTSSSIIPQCSTGNCNFPKFATLAVCSQCVDASHLIVDNTNISITLSNGLTMSVDGNLGPGAIVSNNAVVGFFNVSSTLPSLNLIEKSNTAFVDASFLSSMDDDDSTAHQCVLSFCLEVYQSEVRQGVLTETLEAQFAPSWVEDLFPLIGGHSLSLVLPQSADVTDSSNQTFTTDSLTFVSIQEFWNSSLQMVDHNGTRTLGNMIGNSIFFAMLHDFFNNNSLSALHVSHVMANIAQGMTNSMRQSTNNVNYTNLKNGQPYNQIIQGTSHILETYIQPRWLWLTYPLVMVLLAILFCSLTIRQTARLGLPNWKSSALAAMLHGIQESEEDVLDGTRDGRWAGKEPTSVLEEWADGVDVRLRQRGNTSMGYGLVRVERTFGN